MKGRAREARRVSAYWGNGTKVPTPRKSGARVVIISVMTDSRAGRNPSGPYLSSNPASWGPPISGVAPSANRMSYFLLRGVYHGTLLAIFLPANPASKRRNCTLLRVSARLALAAAAAPT